MVFSSIVFLCLFLPATLAVYYACPPRARNAVALAASLLFYAWGAPRFVFVLIGSSAFDFAIGRRLPPHCAPHRQTQRRILLGAGIMINVGVLLYAKYMNFFVEQLDQLLVLGGRDTLAWTHIALPIGISFFTFQKLSYLVDVYRGEAPPAHNFVGYLLYVALFPQLIAGPIVRYHDIARQLEGRHYASETFLLGVWRFCLGLAKKVLIANVVGVVADRAFGADPAGLGPAAAWFGAYRYALQIYFDFSGYSDMAIGLGRMLGFEFRENFDFPYTATDFTDFWRRWHISLSSWMREYLYLPLGGNRVPAWRAVANLWIVFLISGFWHGAAWNFIVWGAYHGLFLSFDKLRRHLRPKPPPRVLAVPLTFILVLIGWVFFRSENLGLAITYLGAMAGRFADTAAGAGAMRDMLADPTLLLALAVGSLTAIAPLLGAGALRDWRIASPVRAEGRKLVARSLISLLLLLFCLMSLMSGNFNPFIYFRF